MYRTPIYRYKYIVRLYIDISLPSLGNLCQLKNTDYIVDNKVLIIKLSLKGTFLIKNTLVDISF